MRVSHTVLASVASALHTMFAMLKPDIQSLKEGDSRMWDIAFHWLWPVAWSAASRRLETFAPTQIEDIAVVAIREAAELVEDGKVESFEDLKALVSVIANRRAKDLIRRLQAEKRSVGSTETIEGLEEVLASREPGPVERANANDVANVLTALMAQLSREDYELLRAYYFRDRKQREIADTYGMQMGTVGVKLSRALRKLRAEIAKNPELVKELQEALR